LIFPTARFATQKRETHVPFLPSAKATSHRRLISFGVPRV
jgi:hypothetical protein